MFGCGLESALRRALFAFASSCPAANVLVAEGTAEGMPRWDQGELLPENRGALQAHQREAPFALEGDVYAAPTHVNDRHTYSQIALGGPDQITRADILMAQQAARLRNPHAGRSQLSSLQLTDEPPAPKPLPLPPRARAARSSIEITDQLPANAARRPPEGFFYNEHGNLQAKPAYGPRPTQISNALFGGPADSVPYADEQKHTGRAQIPDARAQRQHVDALVFGAQRAGPAHDIDLAPPHEGRRHVIGRSSHVGAELRWEEEAEHERFVPSAPGAPPAGGWAMDAFPAPRSAAAAHELFRPLIDPSQPPYQYQQQQQQYYSPPQQQYAPPPPPPKQYYSPPPPQQQQYAPPPPAQQQYYAPPPPPRHAPKAPTELVDYSRAAAPPRLSPVSQYQLPTQNPSANAAPPAAVSGGPLVYDPVQRRWVTRDGGVPSARDPILRGGPSGGPPTQYDAPTAAAPSGGMRHPKLWLSTAMAEYTKQNSQLPPDLAPRRDANRNQSFTKAFAPPNKVASGFAH